MQRPQSLTSPLCDRPPWRCVVDPLLVFTKYGAPLVRHLSSGMELWIARELWHILNNLSFYLQQPGLLNPAVLYPRQQIDQEYGLLHETLLSLQQWEALRQATDLSRLRLFWLGDSLKESLIPLNIDTHLFKQWESLAFSFDRHIKQIQVQENLLSFALRDTVTLAASLDSAFILTYQSTAEMQNSPQPDICRLLELWGIPCQPLPPQNPIMTMERDSLRQSFIAANTTKFLWSNIQLAVLHLLFPTLAGLPVPAHPSNTEVAFRSEDQMLYQEFTDSNWRGVQGFWYFL